VTREHSLMRSGLVVALLAASPIASSQPAPKAPLEASPYLSEHQLITARVAEQAKAIRAAALVRLNTQYPVLARPRIELGVSGGSRRAEDRINAAIIQSVTSTPGLTYLRTTGGGPGQNIIFSPDWTKVGEFVVGPPNELIFKLDLGKHQVVGSRNLVPPVSSPVFLWNCGPNTKTGTLTDDQFEKITEAQAKVYEQSTSSSIEAGLESGPVGALSSITASFKQSVSKRTEISQNLAREFSRTLNISLPIEIAPFSVFNAGYTIREDLVLSSYRTIVEFDSPIYIRVPTGGTAIELSSQERGLVVVNIARQSSLPNWSLYVGRWSELMPPEARKLEVNLFAAVPTRQIHRDTHTAMTYADTAECEAAQAHFQLTNGLPPSRGREPASQASSASAPSASVQEMLMPMSAVLQESMEPMAGATRGSCRADVRSNARYSGGRVQVRHQVSISQCPVREFQSTGRIIYSLRVRDASGRTQTLGGFESRWKNEKDSRFTVDDTDSIKPEDFPELLDITGVRAVDCGCAEK
jgi:hypothetical protein